MGQDIANVPVLHRTAVEFGAVGLATEMRVQHELWYWGNLLWAIAGTVLFGRNVGFYACSTGRSQRFGQTQH